MHISVTYALMRRGCLKVTTFVRSSVDRAAVGYDRPSVACLIGAERLHLARDLDISL